MDGRGGGRVERYIHAPKELFLEWIAQMVARPERGKICGETSEGKFEQTFRDILHSPVRQ